MSSLESVASPPVPAPPIRLPVIAGVFGGVLVCAMGSLSPYNSEQWLWAGVAIVAVSLILAAKNSQPCFFLIAGYFWAQATGDILVADFAGLPLNVLAPGNSRPAALAYSLTALMVLSAGVRLGLGRGPARPKPSVYDGLKLDYRRVLLFYVVALVVGRLLLMVPVPGSLAQFVLGLYQVKLVALFLIAYRASQLGKWPALAIVLMFEIAIGMSGYISSFQFSVLVVLSAVLCSRSRVSPQIIVAGAAATAVLFAAALFWTAVKPEYRAWSAVERSLPERLVWLAQFPSTHDFKLQNAMGALAERLGYTTYFSYAIARSNVGLIPPDLDFWQNAIEHTLKPRILFPDKPALNDTAVTTLITGQSFGEASVSVGYVAQAYVDFGFPGMLVPMGILGYALARSFRYLRERPSHATLALGLGTVAVVTSFPFEWNIDKAFGGFLSMFLVFIAVERFAGQRLSRWLTCR